MFRVVEVCDYYQLNKNGKVGKFAYIGKDNTKILNGMAGAVTKHKEFDTQKQALEYYKNLKTSSPKLDTTKEFELAVFSKQLWNSDFETIRNKTNFGTYKTKA